MRRRKPAYPPQDLLDERRLWAAANNRCFVCRQPGDWLPLQTHEIASRAQAAGKEWCVPENFVRLCQQCHELFDWVPEAAQLGVKKLVTPDELNIPLINQLRGRGPNAIDIYEVRNWERFIRAVRGERTC